MKSKKIVLNREIVELKHNVLLERIEKVKNKLKSISIFVQCESEIKSIELIKEQYEKMYKAVIETEEYDKYIEVENTIIAQVSRIELQLDRYVYKIAKTFIKELEEKLNEIEKSASNNFTNFHNLNEDLYRIKTIKNILRLCAPYYSQTQMNEAYTKISTLKYQILIRSQIMQIVDDEGEIKNYLKQFDDESERKIFEELFKKDYNNILGEEQSSKVMHETTLLNQTIIEDMINKRPLRYVTLLDWPIFDTQDCEIPTVDYKRDEYLKIKIFKTILSSVVNKKASIIKCKKLYEGFGLAYNPKTLNKGQKLIWRLWENVQKSCLYKYNSSQEEENKSSKYSIHRLKKPIMCRYTDLNKMKKAVSMKLHVHINKSDVRTFYWVDSILINLDDMVDLPINPEKLEIVSEEIAEEAKVKEKEIDDSTTTCFRSDCYLPIEYLFLGEER